MAVLGARDCWESVCALGGTPARPQLSETATMVTNDFIRVQEGTDAWVARIISLLKLF